MWNEGDSHGYAQHLLSGFCRFMPSLRYELHISRQYVKNWERTLTRRRALPLTHSLAMGLAGVALAYQREDLCALLLSGFLGLLRTMEMVTLKPSCISFFTSPLNNI